MSLRSIDLNLLFGVIALQTNFISQSQLVMAFDFWVKNKSQDFAEILMSAGALTRADCDALTQLVTRFLDKHGNDAERSFNALSSVPQVRADLERLGDADLDASLSLIAHSKGDDSLPTMNDVSARQAGRFRIIRAHAKGGLGQVSVALDQDLNREVALKEILHQHAGDSSARQRFVLEAEITGGLEHPGIVPVYALGKTTEGRPFYAMRLVKGESLKNAIAQFHRSDNPNRKAASKRHIELRQLLGRFIDVCNATEYAHSRGVLHRDLKPANIMIGKFGETLVIDWGLAKAIGKPDLPMGEDPLLPATALNSLAQTRPGLAMGTPAYMSPEQAAGKLDALGPTTDVYSLGATLYHILCGRPPFESIPFDELMRKIQCGDFPPPRSVVFQIPRPLEAICLKAMALRVEDRYASARLLANDVEYCLADEPVTAYSEPPHSRLWRWAKHHPWVGRAVGVVTILIVTFFIFSTFFFAVLGAILAILGAATGSVIGIVHGGAKEGSRQGAYIGFRLGTTLGVVLAIIWILLKVAFKVDFLSSIGL